MFIQLIKKFNENIEGLNEFVSSIEPFLIEKQDKFINENSSLFKPLIKAIRNKENGFTDDIDVEIFSKNNQIHYNLSSNQFDDKFFETIDKFKRNDNHIKLLYKNSLISLLSSVEWYFSQVLHTYYNKFPNASGIKKKSLTYEELKKFNSIEEAEKYLIDQKIEAILRSSFSDWIDLLIKEFSLKIDFLISEKNEIIEIYQRRNLLVHNGGLINTVYLSKVDKKYTDNLTLDYEINVDSLYLENAIAKLHINFILLTTELWQKIEPESSIIFIILIDSLLQYFNRRKFSEALQICRYIEDFQTNNTKVKTYNKILLSSILLKLDKEIEAQKFINQINISDCDSYLKICYYSLNNDSENFLIELQNALESGEFELEIFEENPLFEDINKNIQVELFFKKIGFNF